MIVKGSMIILATKDTIFSPCEVIALSDKSITVQYFAGTKKDRETGTFKQVFLTATILMKDVTRMSERL